MLCSQYPVLAHSVCLQHTCLPDPHSPVSLLRGWIVALHRVTVCMYNTSFAALVDRDTPHRPTVLGYVSRGPPRPPPV